MRENSSIQGRELSDEEVVSFTIFLQLLIDFLGVLFYYEFHIDLYSYNNLEPYLALNSSINIVGIYVVILVYIYKQNFCYHINLFQKELSILCLWDS